MDLKTGEKEFIQAKKSALRLLKVRNRSEREIRDRFKIKRYDDKIIDGVIQYLCAHQLLDDRQFTKEWVETRLNRSYGLKKIAFELKAKGISDELIKEALESVKENFSDDAVMALALKRAEKYKNLDKTERNQKIFNYLAYRGFDIDTI